MWITHTPCVHTSEMLMWIWMFRHSFHCFLGLLLFVLVDKAGAEISATKALRRQVAETKTTLASGETATKTITAAHTTHNKKNIYNTRPCPTSTSVVSQKSP